MANGEAGPFPAWLKEAAIGSAAFTNNPFDFKSLVYGKYRQAAIALNVDQNGHLKTDSPRSLFGDMRVALFTPDIGWSFPYTINTLIINVSTTGSGSATQINGQVALSSGTTANSSAAIQTRENLRFSTGMAIRALFHATFSSGAAGGAQAIGLGDPSEGLFFGYNGTQFGVLIRSNGTDQWISQSDWNIDQMDGSGASGLTLDPTMGNIYGIRRLGSEFGTIEFYVSDPMTTELLPVHRVSNANQSDQTLIQAKNLPLRAEVANDTNTSDLLLRTAWAIAGVEGIPNDKIETRQAFYSTKEVPANVETNVFTLRNKETIGAVPNRTPIRFLMLSVAAQAGTINVSFNIRRNAALTGDTTFTDIDSNNSVIAYNTNGDYVAGTGSISLPLQVASFDSYVVDLTPLDMPLPIGETITVTAFTQDAVSRCSVGLSWMEYY